MDIDKFKSGAPFGATLLWGKKSSGKTLAGLNSPWQPVHTIDTENSSKEYYMNQGRLIDMGILSSEFTRAECLDRVSINAEFSRIKNEKPHYGTILIDTGGQWAEWTANFYHSQAASDKVSQITWGKIRDELRRFIIALSKYCDCLLLTAHERKYGPDISPRCNPALIEVAAISIRLVRAPNERLPMAEFVASRIPFFPPRINEFTIAKMLPFFDDPADWKNLKEEDKIPDEPPYMPPTEMEE